MIPIIAAAIQNLTALNASGEISFAASTPNENDPATSTEKSSIAKWPRPAEEVTRRYPELQL